MPPGGRRKGTASRSLGAQLDSPALHPRYGARPLRRVIEREVVAPLSDFITAGQLRRGDVVEITPGDGGLEFQRVPRGAGEVIV